jgi:hypothetical protein
VYTLALTRIACVLRQRPRQVRAGEDILVDEPLHFARDPAIARLVGETFRSQGSCYVRFAYALGKRSLVDVHTQEPVRGLSLVWPVAELYRLVSGGGQPTYDCIRDSAPLLHRVLQLSKPNPPDCSSQVISIIVQTCTNICTLTANPHVIAARLRRAL